MRNPFHRLYPEVLVRDKRNALSRIPGVTDSSSRDPPALLSNKISTGSAPPKHTRGRCEHTVMLGLATAPAWTKRCLHLCNRFPVSTRISLILRSSVYRLIRILSFSSLTFSTTASYTLFSLPSTPLVQAFTIDTRRPGVSSSSTYFRSLSNPRVAMLCTRVLPSGSRTCRASRSVTSAGGMRIRKSSSVCVAVSCPRLALERSFVTMARQTD
jgi:hypothetical protein